MRIFSSSLLLASALAGLAVVACSGADDVSGSQGDASSQGPVPDHVDAGTPPGDAAVDATTAHVTPPPLPVIPNQGGPILANPELVTVTWAGDPIADGLEAFDTWLITSATWKTMMAEWGVGAGKYSGSARLAAAAPASLSEDDVAALLRSGFQAGTIPRPNGSRIYMIYPPAGTAVTSFGAAGCDAFQAYHYAVDIAATPAGPATKAYFSVTPRCASTQGLSALDYVTWGSSHEAMEAASDPVAANPAWRIDVQSLATPELGENADLCGGQPVKIEGHLITRNWSNVAAKAGERPCVPAPPGPMFGLFAEPGEVTIAPGKSTTVTLRAYASGTYPAFSVGAYSADPALSVTLSAKTARDGDTLTMTVTATAAFVEQPGQNLVFLLGQGKDYATKRHLIVHAK
ncbi:hypothetical protein BH11MYX4_BH11MYX4_07850 [soil metagenome]